MVSEQFRHVSHFTAVSLFNVARHCGGLTGTTLPKTDGGSDAVIG